MTTSVGRAILILGFMLMLGCKANLSERKAQVIRQESSNDCGPAALAMILFHYGLHVHDSTFTKAFSLTDQGASVSEMIRVANMYGLSGSGWKLTPERLAEQKFPAIMFVDGDHFVVVDSLREGAAYLRDPAVGRVMLRDEDLKSRWDGTTILFEEGPNVP